MTQRPRGQLTRQLTRLEPEHVQALAAGATLLGSGGGGAVQLGRLQLEELLRRRPVALCDAGVLDPDGWVVHVGVVGAPDVLAERLVHPDDLAAAARAVSSGLDGRLAGVGVIEIGGLNALAAAMAAARVGVPLVDGDLMGRAYPTIGQTTLALSGEAATPLAIVGAAGDVVVVTSDSLARTTRLLGAAVAGMGGAAALALFPIRPQKLHQLGIRASVSTCVRLGKTYLAARDLPPKELIATLGGRMLAEGRIDEVRSRSGPLPGSATMEDTHREAVVRLDYLDELLAVTSDGVTVARTPEIIVALHAATVVPLRTDQLRPGQAIVVFSLPALHQWPPAAARLVGPAGFGMELEETG